MEIGSGGGRWTKYLLDFGRLYVTDLNKEFFPYLLDRFGPRPNISFCHSSGADLPGIPKNSIDFVFSFGVFVHIETDVIKEYLKTIKEICKEDGDIVIQYSEKNKPQAVANKLYSFNTREIMSGLVKEQGFSIISEDLETLKSANVIHFSPSTPKRAELSVTLI